LTAVGCLAKDCNEVRDGVCPRPKVVIDQHGLCTVYQEQCRKEMEERNRKIKEAFSNGQTQLAKDIIDGKEPHPDRIQVECGKCQNYVQLEPEEMSKRCPYCGREVRRP